MSFIDGLYHYELYCKIVDKVSGAVLREFKARAMTARDFNVSNVAGGIASYGQSYQVATLELQEFEVLPKMQKVIIDNQGYQIRQISIISVANPWNVKKKRIEKILLLE